MGAEIVNGRDNAPQPPKRASANERALNQGAGASPATLCVRAFSRESLDPPPGTGWGTTPQVWTCASPERTTCRKQRRPARPPVSPPPVDRPGRRAIMEPDNTGAPRSGRPILREATGSVRRQADGYDHDGGEHLPSAAVVLPALIGREFFPAVLQNGGQHRPGELRGPVGPGGGGHHHPHHQHPHRPVSGPVHRHRGGDLPVLRRPGG